MSLPADLRHLQPHQQLSRSLNQRRLLAEHEAMVRIRSIGASCVRWRYALLGLWMLPWLIAAQSDHYPHGDWVWVELGARILVHHHAPPSGGASLHLYADTPAIQMGPPSLLVAAPFQWLSPQVEGHLVAGIMSVLVLFALWCAERAAETLGSQRWLPGRTLLVGLVAVPVWTVQAQRWGHIDDVTALLAVMVAVVLVSRGRHEVMAGLILGTGAAAKPWAVLVLPLLFAFARPQMSRAVLAFIVGALAWWVPFVLAAPGTIHALGSMTLHMANHPTWQLFGITGWAPSWIRPFQLLGGLVLSSAVVRRAGWAAVPAVALAWRVTSDPYDWSYYVMGPLIGAALWDLARSACSRWASLPWATIAVCVAELAAPRIYPSAAAGARLLWFLALTATVFAVTPPRAWLTEGGAPETEALGAIRSDVQLVAAVAKPTAEPALP